MRVSAARSSLLLIAIACLTGCRSTGGGLASAWPWSRTAGADQTAVAQNDPQLPSSTASPTSIAPTFTTTPPDQQYATQQNGLGDATAPATNYGNPIGYIDPNQQQGGYPVAQQTPQTQAGYYDYAQQQAYGADPATQGYPQANPYATPPVYTGGAQYQQADARNAYPPGYTDPNAATTPAAGQYATGQYSTGQYSTGQYASGSQYPTADQYGAQGQYPPAGQYPAAGQYPPQGAAGTPNPYAATQPWAQQPATAGAPAGTAGAYQNPATGYQPGSTGYQPGNTGYTPAPYQSPNPYYPTTQSAPSDPHYRPGNTGDYIPATTSGQTGSPAAAPRSAAGVTPAAYQAGTTAAPDVFLPPSESTAE